MAVEGAPLVEIRSNARPDRRWGHRGGSSRRPATTRPRPAAEIRSVVASAVRGRIGRRRHASGCSLESPFGRSGHRRGARRGGSVDPSPSLRVRPVPHLAFRIWDGVTGAVSVEYSTRVCGPVCDYRARGSPSALVRPRRGADRLIRSSSPRSRLARSAVFRATRTRGHSLVTTPRASARAVRRSARPRPESPTLDAVGPASVAGYEPRRTTHVETAGFDPRTRGFPSVIDGLRRREEASSDLRRRPSRSNCDGRASTLRSAGTDRSPLLASKFDDVASLGTVWGRFADVGAVIRSLK